MSILLGQLKGTNLSHGHPFPQEGNSLELALPLVPHHTHSFDHWWDTCSGAHPQVGGWYLSIATSPEGFFLTTQTNVKQPSQESCLQGLHGGGIRVEMAAKLFNNLHFFFLCSVASNSLQPYELYSNRFLCPWNFPGKNTGVS